MDKVKTDTAELFFDENDILNISILPESHIDVEDAANNFIAAKTLSQGNAVLKLIDLRARFSATKTAWSFIEKEESKKQTTAKAFVINGFLKKVYKNIWAVKKEVPTYYFNSPEKAKVWLLSFKQD